MTPCNPAFSASARRMQLLDNGRIDITVYEVRNAYQKQWTLYSGRSGMNSVLESDNRLLAAFADHGDEDAFRQLVERYYGCVLSVCCRVTANPSDAQDAAQASFLVLARRAAEYRNRTDLIQCLFRIARNCALNVRRNEKLRRERESQAGLHASIHSQREGKSPLQYKLDELVAALPEKYRTAVLMHYMQGLPLAEVATRTGVSTDGATKRVSRAREKLRQLAKKSDVAIPVASMVAMLSHDAAAAQVSATTISSTAAAATAMQQSGFAAAAKIVGSHVVQIGTAGATGSKLKSALAVAAAILLVGSIAAGIVLSSSSPSPAPIELAEGVLFADDFSSTELSNWRIVQSKDRSHYGVENGKLALRPNPKQGGGWPKKGHGVYTKESFDLPLRLEMDVSIPHRVHGAMAIEICLTPNQMLDEQRLMIRGDDYIFIHSPIDDRSKSLGKTKHNLQYPTTVKLALDLHRDGRAIAYADGVEVMRAQFPDPSSKAYAGFLLALKGNPPEGMVVSIDNVRVRRLPEEPGPVTASR